MNTCSIFPKMPYIKKLISETNIHIICVSETWLNNTHTDAMVGLYGFNLVRHDRSRTDKGRGGGVAIYIRSDLSFTVKHTSAAGEMLEYVFAEVATAEKSFLVGCAYNPPDSPSNFGTLGNILSNALYDDIIVAGDLNLNMMMENRYTLGFSELLCQSGSVVINNLPTHFKPNCAPSCLDLFISNTPDKVVMIDQLDAPGLSHHDVIVLSYNLLMKPVPCDRKYYRNYKRICEQSLVEELYTLPWQSIYYLTEPDEQLEQFNSLVLYLFEKHVPLCEARDRRPHVVCDRALDRLIARRDLVHKRWRRQGNVEDWDLFKSLRSEASDLETQLLQDHYSSLFSPQLSSKELWRNIKSLGYKDIPTNSGFLSSTALNNHFISSSSTTAPVAPVHAPEASEMNHITFSLSNVTSLTVMRALTGIKSNAIGNDQIPPRFIKLILPHILSYLTHIFNTILTSSKFPASWTVAKVIPIPKTKNPRTAGDYRPISILSYTSKAFERIVADQMQSYISSNNLMTTWQSGFRPNRSTVTPLLDVTEMLRQSLDHKEIGILALLDFSKAFDTVNHSILLRKLMSQFNFSSCTIRLLNSYLSGRTQFVSQTNDASSYLSLTCGVPQGSVLGPLLFSIYINDLPAQMRHTRCHLYADDVQLVSTGCESDGNALIHKVNEDLSRAHQWALANCLVLNPKKSTSILFSRKVISKDQWPKLELNHVPIPFVSTARNLGVWFDEHLNWGCHVETLCKSVRSSVSRLRKIAWALPINTRLRMVRSLIVPILSYGSPVFNSRKISTQKKLISAINSCTRFVYGLRMRDSLSPYANRILGCTLSQHYDMSLCRSLFQISMRRDPAFLAERLAPNRSTRNPGFVPPRNLHTAYDGMFYIRGVQLWNRLPRDIKRSPNINTFSAKLKALVDVPNIWS